MSEAALPFSQGQATHIFGINVIKTNWFLFWPIELLIFPLYFNTQQYLTVKESGLEFSILFFLFYFISFSEMLC